MWTPSNQILKYLNVGNAPSAILFLLCFFILTPEDSDWKTLTLVLTVNSLSEARSTGTFPHQKSALAFEFSWRLSSLGSGLWGLL